MKSKRLCIFLIAYFCFWGYELNAQFYNGHQMTFGKNRVQYNDFYWSFMRYEQFDTYFNEYGKDIAIYAAEHAKQKIPVIEDFFDHSLDDRIIFIVYNKLTDFRQSNIGLVTGKEEYNVGGKTQIVRNKVFLFFEGDYREFEQQIEAAIARVVLNESLFGIDLTENVATSTLSDYPDWFTEGLISYASDGWDHETENRIRDGIMTGRFEKIGRLTGEEAVWAGHSFWKYIADVYGEGVIPNILYLSKVNRKINSGFLNVLGLSLKELSYDWQGYYFSEFELADQEAEELPNDHLIKRPRKKHVYTQVNMNPNGKYVAYVTNNDGKYKVWVYNMEEKKKTRVFKEGHKLEQINDYSFPVLEWHPSGRILTFITEEKGGLNFYFYTIYNDELTSRNLLYFDKVLDYSFSSDGTLLAMSAVKNGKTDIYVHTLASSTNEQITDDYADDLNPRFYNEDNNIVFSSDRRDLALENESENMDLRSVLSLYSYNYSNGNQELTNISGTAFANRTDGAEIKRHKYIHINDYNGVKNAFITKFDSVVSYIDTAVHYRYTAYEEPLTDYPRNITEFDYDEKTGKYGKLVYQDDRYFLYTGDDTKADHKKKDLFITSFFKNHKKRLREEDSLSNIQVEEIYIDKVEDNQIVIEEDTLNLGNPWVDINNYIFEREKINMYNEKIQDKNVRIVLDTIEEKTPKVRIYQTVFYPDYLVSQVDFSFLNASYQQFTGGAVYFNPGFNMLFKLGTNDLFEDYKITGGYRFSGDFDANEYLVSLENLKGRLDKQFIFHRQTYKNVVEDEGRTFGVKTYTHEAYGIFRYPFSQVGAVALTTSFRHDRTAFLTNSATPASLQMPDRNKYWLGVKTEYIFDNTRNLGINLYSGTRLKLFTEAYKKLNDGYDDLYVVGMDIRNYFQIHRNLIFASRLAASASYGSNLLIYYLGGVDNWTNLIPNRVPTFIPTNEIPIDYEKDYAFQTVATNMRGFSQNIRNGDRFALMNFELRWPVISYFMNYPLSSSMLENFQVVGFFDVGSAWSGMTPYSGENAYNNKVYPRTYPGDEPSGPYKITVDAQRDPIVAGYGAGVRTQVLGYFVRLDWAWGIENRTILPRVFYFSLSLDF